MKRLAIVIAAVLFSGCGAYVAHGGGAYSFVGIGSNAVARRCSPWFTAKQESK